MSPAIASDATVRHRDDRALDADPHGWRREGRDLLRALAAGAIVGMPLLYTMEMWQHGMTLSPWHLLALLAATLVVNFAIDLTSGFRRETSVGEAVSESIASVGLGMLFSFTVLCLIGEIRWATSWSSIIGRTLIETAPVSLGISFANRQIRNRSRLGDDDQDDSASHGRARRSGKDDDESPGRMQLQQDLKDLGATVCGAIVFAYNVAPTEEIVVIASRLSPLQHGVLVAASLVLCYLILFAAQFRERQVHVPGPFQSPLAETAMAYAVSLLVAGGLLWLVGVREAMSAPSSAVMASVTLALPASVGGAAGRLIT